MKKWICSALFISASSACLAQGGSDNWKTNGNTPQAGSFFGTLTNFPLEFRVNNSPKMTLDGTGDLKLTNLAGTGNRVLLTDATGVLTSMPAGLPGQFLQGNGTWASLPGGATAWQLIGSNLIATNGGNIGIGTNNPTSKLSINGDLSVSSNVYVGGGLVTTSTVSASSKVSTGDIDVGNNLSIGNTILFGQGMAQGAYMKFVQGSQNVPAMLQFGGQGIQFPGGGGTDGNPNPTPNLSCLAPYNINLLNAFPQSLVASTTNNNQNNTVGSIFVGHNWDKAFIESASSAAVPPSPANHHGDLFINQSCGRNVLFFNHIAPFGAGLSSAVSIDGKLNVRQHIQLGDPSIGFTDPASRLYILTLPNTVGIRIKHGASGSPGIKITTYNDAGGIMVTESSSFNNDGNETFSVNGNGSTAITTTAVAALSIFDGVNNISNFSVNNNGKTKIGVQTQQGQGSFHTDAMLTVYGKFVSRSAYVTIIGWGDYVFDSKYKLASLYDVEKYYKENHHLSEIPSATEVEKEGVNIGEITKIAIKKIEELTLYTVEQQKEIDALKAEVKAMKKEKKCGEK